MRIIQFQAENVKRIKAIEITPKEDVIILSGKNEQGKTSVLDAIWSAIKYRAAAKKSPDLLRAGEDNGYVTIDLGDYIVTRKFTESGSTLEVRTPEGVKQPSPQKLLDGLYNDLSFDPWEFARKKKEDQREMLADVLYTITEGELDLSSFDVRREEAYNRRKDANKEKQRLATSLSNIAPPVGTDPQEEISISDLTASINAAMDVRSENLKLEQEKAAVDREIQQVTDKLAELEKKQLALKDKIENAPEVPDIVFMQGELENIEKLNRRARDVMNYRKIHDALGTVEDEIKSYNEEMELIDIEKQEALENSPLPINGIKLTAEGVMVVSPDGEDVPFCQASAAQKLKISLAIAMAANPKIRVIRIADGSLFGRS